MRMYFPAGDGPWPSSSRRSFPVAPRRVSHLPACSIPSGECEAHAGSRDHHLDRGDSDQNRLWGAERIRRGLLRVGIRVSKRTIEEYMRSFRPHRGGGHTWSTFVQNQAHDIWCCDSFRLTICCSSPCSLKTIVPPADADGMPDPSAPISPSSTSPNADQLKAVHHHRKAHKTGGVAPKTQPQAAATSTGTPEMVKTPDGHISVRA